MNKLANSIASRFCQIADKFENKTAICCEDKSLTYRQLKELSCKYAIFLTKNGVKYGDVIGVPLNISIESVALMLASSIIGAALAPVNATLPAEDLVKAFKSACVKHIVARKSFFNDMAGTCLQGSNIECKLCLDGTIDGIHSFSEVLNEHYQVPDLSILTGNETFILTLTSGSTGTPKPIELTQKNKLERADAHIQLYGINFKDRILAATPLYHSLAERLVIMPLIVGATSVLLPRFTPENWFTCVAVNRITFTIAVSSQLKQIAKVMKEKQHDISDMRLIVSSSALLEESVKKILINQLNCEFHEMYGTSECSTVTDLDFSRSKEKQGSIGKPLPNVEVKILDERHHVLPNGNIGEIAVKTPLLCNSYYLLPEKMKMSTTGDGYFLTGDLGKKDEEGFIYYKGRKKDIIITGGINVFPQDIEQKILELNGVVECAAFAIPDEHLGESVALAVIIEKDSEITTRSLRLFCAKKLADFQQPHHFFFVEKLPKNTMGKLERRKLPMIIQTQKRD